MADRLLTIDEFVGGAGATNLTRGDVVGVDEFVNQPPIEDRLVPTWPERRPPLGTQEPLPPLTSGQGQQQGRLGAFGAGVAQGATGTAASAVQRLGLAGVDGARRVEQILDEIDKAGLTDPAAIRTEVNKRALPFAEAGIALQYGTGTPEERAEIRDTVKRAVTPEENPIYRAGAAVSEAGERWAPIDKRWQDAWTTQLGRGIGSMATFAAGGIALGGLGAGAGVGAALLGSAVQGTDQFHDAIASGADIDAAFKAMRLGDIIGTSEGVPIGMMLNKLDKLSGGTVKRILVEGFKGGFEEMAQEVFQQIASNLIASDLVKYDPDRAMFIGTVEGGSVGFSVGALFGAIVGAIGGRHGGGAQLTPEQRQAIENLSPNPSTVGANQRQATAAETPGFSGLRPRTPTIGDTVVRGGAGVFDEAPGGTPGVGERTRAAEEPPVLSEADKRSPIPNDVLEEGYKVLRDIGATSKADEILRSLSLPTVGTNVDILFPDGRTERGTVADGFVEPIPELGVETRGFKIDLERGGIYEDYASSHERSGVRITARPEEPPPTKGEVAGAEAAQEAGRSGLGVALGKLVVPNRNQYAGPTPEPDPVATAIAIRPAAVTAIDVALSRHGITSLTPIDGDGETITMADATGRVVRLGLAGAVAEVERPNLAEMLMPETKGVINGVRFEITPKAETGRVTPADIAAVKASVESQGFTWNNVTSGQLGHVGRRLVILDPDGIRKMSAEEKATYKERQKTPAAPAATTAAEIGTGLGEIFGAPGSQPAEKSEQGQGIAPTAAQSLPTVTAGVPTAAEVDVAAAEADPNPTAGMAGAGNYKKGHVTVHGMDISIETAMGETRRGYDEDGNEKWANVSPAHYGYVRRTEGADGEQIDVYVGRNPASQKVWVIDQRDLNSDAFDEHKVMLGFDTQEQAEETYAGGFSDGKGRKRIMATTEMDVSEFKALAAEGKFDKPMRARGLDGGQATGRPTKKRAPIDDMADDVASVYRRDGAEAGNARARQIAKEKGLTVAQWAVLQDKVVEQLFPPSPEMKKAQAEIDAALHPIEVAKAFAKALAAGRHLDTIVQARKFAADMGADLDAKALEEAIEVALVMRAREIVADGIEKKHGRIAVYSALVALYNQQPNLAQRTSTSVESQAYSTPAPLAWVAAIMAKAGPKAKVYEPAAGNGMLLLAASPENIVANEIQAARRANLRLIFGRAATLTGNDAVEWDPRGRVGPGFDAVVTNPPFGPLPDGRLVKLVDGPPTAKIDHAIAWRALRTMKDDGRAVILIAGTRPMGQTQKREDFYRELRTMTWFRELYAQYNVVDHFTIDGKLYSRQGAGWPVDVIVIHGRGKSALKLPTVAAPRVYGSWDQLGEVLNGKVPVDAARQPDGAGDDRTRKAAAREADAGDVPSEALTSAGGPDRGGGTTTGAGVAQPSGERGGAQPVAAERPITGDAGERTGGKQQPVAGVGGVSAGADQGAASAGQRGGPERGQPRDIPREAVPPVGGVDAEVSTALAGALDDIFGAKAPPPLFGPKSIARDGADRVIAAGLEGVLDGKPASPAPSTSSAADEIADGLNSIFKGSRRQDVDEATYKRALPHFINAAKQAGVTAKSAVGDLVRAIAKYLAQVAKMARDVIERMLPYIQQFAADVADRTVSIGEEVDARGPTKERAKNAEVETKYQVQYEPTSKAKYAVGTLSPINMQAAMNASLKALEGRVGNIDEFVASELGYSLDELLGTDENEGFFSAEQVDAIALALDAIQGDAGFVIGDQTGVGKGRVVAAIIRYAIRNKKVPIFLTKEPGLYADLIRDLRDIGMPDIVDRIFPTNNDLRGERGIPLSEMPGDVLYSRKPGLQRSMIAEMAKTGSLPKGVDVIFTTYDQTNLKKLGDRTERHHALVALAPNAIFILDESHEAGGGEVRKRNPETGENIQTRADFIREILLDSPNGALYSSATYAKRPEVMSLYFKTDLSKAVDDISKLTATIKAGGIPLQQVVANMLVESGQYVRRERSYDGVDMNYLVVPVDIETARVGSKALNTIFTLDIEYMAEVRDAFIEHLATQGEGAEDSGNAIGVEGAKSIGFANVMHNVISQMLLALKAPQVVAEAIKAAKRGEKPIIALSNTMEAILDDYAAAAGIDVGSEVNITFNVILARYLQRLRRITLNDGYGNITYYWMTDDEIAEFGGDVSLAEFKRVVDVIDKVKLDGLTAAPIDLLLDELEDAGIPTGEITGRSQRIDHNVLRDRKHSAADKKRTLAKYNSGESTGMILNRSGSTGLSAHATGKRGNDGKVRHMFILQAEPNIDYFMQILGRIHRTGQTELPKYTIIAADLAVEKRPMAVQMKKMASLNANTTAAKHSAVTLEDAPDFLNHLGDDVVVDFLRDNPAIANAVDVHPGLVNVDIAQKFTGRLALLQPELVIEVYRQVEEAYAEYVEALDRMGMNTLEAKTLDLDAKPLESMVLVPEKDGHESDPSRFTEAALAWTMDVRKLGKPYTEAELKDEIEKATTAILPDIQKQVKEVVEQQVITPEAAKEKVKAEPAKAAIDDEWLTRAREEVRSARLTADASQPDRARKIAYYTNAKLLALMPKHLENIEAKIAEAEEALANAKTKSQAARANRAVASWSGSREEATARLDNIIARIRPYRVGSAWMLAVVDGDNTHTIPAVVLGVDVKGVKNNPTAASNIKIRFAIADAGREIRIPLSKIVGERQSYSTMEEMTLLDAIKSFVDGLREAREKRIILTGNILAGYAQFRRGQIIMFRTANGEVRQGVLMARNFNLKGELAKNPVVFKDPAHAIAFLKEEPGKRMVKSEDGIFAIVYEYGDFSLMAKARGGKPYFLNRAVRDIIGDWEQRKGQKLYRNTAHNEVDAIQVLRLLQENLGATFETTEAKDAARRITGDGDPEKGPDDFGGGPGKGARRVDEKIAPQDPAKARQQSAAEALLNELTSRLKALGIDDAITARVVKAISIKANGRNYLLDGAYGHKLIQIALDAKDARWTLNHEVIHALRDIGLISDTEWARLELAARADKARLAELQRQYPDLSERELLEEAIADMFADWARGRHNGGLIRALLERIRDFLTSLGWVLSSRGYRTVKDVYASNIFGKIEEGEVGARTFDAAGNLHDGEGKFISSPDRHADKPGPMGIAQEYTTAWLNSPHDIDGSRRYAPLEFFEQRYQHSQHVRVTWPDGMEVVDEVKGLNAGHAMYRARDNWPGAKVEAITEDEASGPLKGARRAGAPPTPTQAELLGAVNAEQAREMADSRGITRSPDGIAGAMRDWFSKFARHFEHLPNTPKWANAIEWLRIFEGAAEDASTRTIRLMRDITKGMARADYDVFVTKVILDDLVWEAGRQRDINVERGTPDEPILLPFKFRDQAHVQDALDRVNAYLVSRPDLRAAVRRRKAIVTEVARRLVQAGVLTNEQIKNPAYYRHQVLEYMNAVDAFHRSPEGKSVKAPYWWRREGSALNINTNLLEAEYDWLYKAFVDISDAETVQRFKDSNYNIHDRVKAMARAHNEQALDDLLTDDHATSGSLTAQWEGFRQRIAFGIDTVRRALASGQLTGIPDEFQEAAQALEDKDHTNGDGNFLQFMTWVFSNNLPGAIGAATVFKAINQRRQWMRAHLGSEYADTRDMEPLLKRFGIKPTAAVAWQPRKGNIMFLAKTIPEHVIDRLVLRIMEGGPELAGSEEGAVRNEVERDLRTMLAVGGPRYQMVIPPELATTLDGLRAPHTENMLSFLTENLHRKWKIAVTHGPHRIVKYTINNTIGDLEGIVAGNPKAVRNVARAIAETFDVVYRGGQPSPEYIAASKLSVFSSGLTVQEIPDVNELAEFAPLMDKKNDVASITKQLTWDKIVNLGRGVLRASRFRDNILRYAAFLNYSERLAAGEDMKSIGYGASFKPVIDAIDDNEIRAAKLARDLVLDYGDVSVHGQWLRRYIVSFWSWMERNTVRYNRLISNAYYRGGIGEGLRAGGVIAAGVGLRSSVWLTSKMVAIWAGFALFNLLNGEDDDDDLSDEDKARMHLYFGKAEDGSPRYMRVNGALGDYVSWLGFPDAISVLQEFDQGRADWGDVTWAIAGASINRIINGVTPIISTPFKVASGYTFYPDVMEPVPIRDQWRELFRTVGFEHEYDHVFGKPNRGWMNTVREIAMTTRREPGEIAYNAIRDKTYNWLEKEKGYSGAAFRSTPRSEVVYAYRQAVRMGDEKAEAAAFERMKALGMRRDDLKEAIKNAHPLAAVSVRDRRKFLATLSPSDRGQLTKAIDWYKDVFGTTP